MWFKKKANISGYNSNTAVDGTDWRTNLNSNTWFGSNILPSAADANKYFYLPALGNYTSGQLNYVGSSGYYWLSSASPWSRYFAYYLLFSSPGTVIVDNLNRGYGYRVDGFE